MCDMLTVQPHLIVKSALSFSDVDALLRCTTEFLRVNKPCCCFRGLESNPTVLQIIISFCNKVPWSETVSDCCVQETHCGTKVFESCRPVLECARRCLVGPASRGAAGSPCFLIFALHHPPLNGVTAPGLWQIPVSHRCCAPAPRCSTRQPFPYHNCPGSHRPPLPHYPLTNASEPLGTPPPRFFC